MEIGTTKSAACVKKADVHLRTEKLQIVPYARSPSHAFMTRGILREWDNGWDNCWHNGDWVDGAHPWQNVQQQNKPGMEAIWNNFITATSANGELKRLKDALVVRDDGFIHNKLNEIVFHADQYSLRIVKELLEKPAKDVAQTHQNILKLLWLN